METESAAPNAERAFLTGWRLHLTSLGVVLTLLLINLEVTIVSTSLVAITNELDGYGETSWIVSAYLITYMGFMILWSKLSDIIGRKVSFLATVFIFTAFSGACGGASTMTQLIICRTFQGIGGAGGYSLSTLMTYEMVPKSKLPVYGAVNAASVAFATLLGPLFGGLINNHTTWRWVFYLNLPAGACVMAILFLAIPPGFPHNGSPASRKEKQTSQSTLQQLKRIDVVGGILMLASSLLASSALLETSNRFGWSNGGTISLLVLSGICWIFFFAWEWFVSKDTVPQEPLFPWKFIYDRSWMGMLTMTFLAGVPFNVVVVFLPQRLQIVSGQTPLDAGIHLLPYTFGAAFGAALANALGSKRRLAIAHVLLIGAALQVLGLALLSTLPITNVFPSKGYGFATLAGIGMGLSFGMLVLATPFMVDQQDLSVASGAIIQFRFLGGVIGLAIATSILNSRIKSHLAGVLDARMLAALFESTTILESLPQVTKEEVIHIFAQEYNFQNYVMVAFAGAQILAVLVFWNHKWASRGWIQ
ncbi:putative efflux pump antibiotic resistance protein [Polyplosphaeria fusca]|uniref:Efflux pump antibiotic resistance protein n=1 Tax=Polyplosphaeria fusca TaxID=682080 RepID=A0A9P4QNP1_9PLEO|nr:putative efflux pump antibiotic resistance protein [Polyplosphaeria fusca]